MNESLPLEEPRWAKDYYAPEQSCPWVDVWRVELIDPAFNSGNWDACLSTAERERADRFRFDKDRRSYRVSHAAKRWILSQYCESNPEDLQFGNGPWGKPYLTEQAELESLQFNLSHSHGQSLIAVGRLPYLGVDVERLQTVERMRPILRRFASRSELEWLGESPGRWTQHCLTAWWVAKEAFVKSVGRGLSLGLGDFSVAMSTTSDWMMQHVPKEFGTAEEYRLRLFKVGTGHLGAVVVRHEEMDLRTHSWRPILARES